jgi:hypothetical protein
VDEKAVGNQSLVRILFLGAAGLLFPRWYRYAMRRLGHNMQVAGLVVLPLGMLLQLASAISLGQMLTMMLAGVALFGIGRIVEGYAPR